MFTSAHPNVVAVSAACAALVLLGAPALASATQPPASEPAPEQDRRSGAHLRPERDPGLTKAHAVDLSSGRYVPGKGLTFTSKDNRFELATRLRAQFLYGIAHEGEAKQTSQSIQIRRARIQFKGHLWNEHNRFSTELAISPRDLGFQDGNPTRTPLLDWYMDFTYLRDLSFRIGQYKLPYSRQRVISSGNQQLVDRSLANAEFNIDRDVGFDIHSKDFLGLDRLRYHAGVYMGEGRDQFQSTNFEMLYLARVEVLPFGIFDDYKEADFDRAVKPRVSVGMAYAFHDGAMRNRGVLGSAPTDGGTTDYHNVNADIVFKIAGFSLFTDFYVRRGKRTFGTATTEDELGVEVPAALEGARTGLGWSAQAGVLIPRSWFEIATRYGQTRRTEADSEVPDRDEVGGGLNYYFAGHPLKLQLDYFARWSDGTVTNTDHHVRLQLQAGF